MFVLMIKVLDCGGDVYMEDDVRGKLWDGVYYLVILGNIDIFCCVILLKVINVNQKLFVVEGICFVICVYRVVDGSLILFDNIDDIREFNGLRFI